MAVEFSDEIEAEKSVTRRNVLEPKPTGMAKLLIEKDMARNKMGAERVLVIFSLILLVAALILFLIADNYTNAGSLLP